MDKVDETSNQDTIAMPPIGPAIEKYQQCTPIPPDDEYYSVEFGLNQTPPVYQFKLRHSDRFPHFFLLKETSELADQLKVGEIISMKYYCNDPMRDIEEHETRIEAMVKETKGRFKGHYRIKVNILGNDMAEPLHATGTGY